MNEQKTLAAGDSRNCQSCGGGDITWDCTHAEGAVRAAESFVPDFPTAMWNRLVARIEKDHEFLYRVGRHTPEEIRTEFAGRILHEAIGFLTLIAKNPGVGFSPSPLVDIGWHNFILYTNEYAAWCRDNAGRFIHHSPFDEEGVDYGTGHSVRTVDALRASGWPVDDMLWMSSTLTCDMRVISKYNCGPCDSSAGYDCGSTHEGTITANNGNCGGQSCSDACGGGNDITLSTVTTITANDGNCGGQGSGDACGGGQDGGSDGN